MLGGEIVLELGWSVGYCDCAAEMKDKDESLGADCVSAECVQLDRRGFINYNEKRNLILEREEER